MPLQITGSGLQIQDLQEIVDELTTEFKNEFGANFKTGEGSAAGKFIGIVAERESKYQSLLQAVIQVLDPLNATGAFLEVLCYITNTERKDETKSKSSSFLATGTPGTNIINGRQFKNNQTGDLWNIVDGPYVIGGGGTIPVTAEANEAGPIEFFTSGPTEWSITIGVPGWSTIEATADIDPEDIGRLDESDGALRDRRRDELLVNGNDLDAIRANVGAIDAVSSVNVFENQSCVVVVDGIPPGAFETVVDGGSDQDIIDAIYIGKPPGAEAFGSTNGNATDSEGNLVPIGFSRPTDIDFWMLIVCDTTGAEGDLPTNAEELVLQAALAYGNANFNTPGFDVVPQAFIGTIFETLRDSQGRDSVTSVDIQLSLDNGPGTAPAYPPGFPAPGAGVDPYSTAVRSIAIRERADFDSARIGVTIS